jgi:Tol biopolymer transport system component
MLLAVTVLALAATQLASAGTGAVNGASIVFSSTRGGTVDLYLAGPDGRGMRRFTGAGAGAYQGDAAWSPDGSRLVFTCGNYELCVANADGSGAVRLTTSLWPRTWSYDFEPAWSPDGGRIVFSGKRQSKSTDLWIVGADGTGLRKLLGTDSYERHPDWSPDGTRIVYSAGGDLRVVNADGTGARSLTSSPNVFESDPDWSPDGTTLAYERSAGNSGTSHIWLMGAEGGGQRSLTTGTGEEEPSWLPDGSALLFSGPVGTDVELFSIRPDGSGRTRLATGRGGDYTPQHQPTGVTVAMPAMPSTPLAPVHADARVVGVFMARQGQLSYDLLLFAGNRKSVLDGARALIRDGAAGYKALAATKPVSREGRRVRSEGMEGFRVLGTVGRQLLTLSRFSGTGPRAKRRLEALQASLTTNLERAERHLENAYLETGV